VFTATGGSGTGYTWCVQSASNCVESGSPLPTGFTLTSSGLLFTTGTPPAAAGSYPFTVQVTDSGDNTVTQAFNLAIVCSMSVSPSALGVSTESPTGAVMFAQAFSSAGLTIPAAAQACQFSDFEWQQTILHVPCPDGPYLFEPSVIPLQNQCNVDESGPPPPYSGAVSLQVVDNITLLDPPQGGTYYWNEKLNIYTSGYDPYPFYYPLAEVQAAEQNPSSECNPDNGFCLITSGEHYFGFYDVPEGLWEDTSASLTPATSNYKEFITSLVGVSPSQSSGGQLCAPNSTYYCTALYSWRWNTTYNGTSGGITLLDDSGINQAPPDPGSGAGGVTITSINGVPTPTVTVTPSATSIITAQRLSVTVAVDGVSGSPTATGSVTLSSGSYTSSATALSNGSVTISIPSGTLATGSYTLTAVYTPDNASAATFSVSSGFALITVTVPLLTSTITVTPSSTSIQQAQTLPVTITVSGGSGNPTPTGTVTLSSSSYISATTSLSSGAATITVPANALSAGIDTLTANYSPDSNSSSTYNSATGSASVTVSGTTSGPGIQSVSDMLPQQTQTITITGSGFGTHAAYNGDSAYIAIGDGMTWQAGYANSSMGIDDAVTLSISSWTDTQIVLAGFTGAYGSGGWTLNQGDQLSVNIWNAQTGAGPYTCSNIVVGTGPTTCGTIPVAVTPTVTVTPASTSITAAQALTVTVVVSGGTGNPTPTGSVILTGGGYTSAATALSSDSASINIPAGALATGSDTLMASYTPDSNSSSTYNSATGTSPQVTVTAAPANPSFTVSGTAVAVAPGATTGNVSTITVTPASGFTGSVALVAAITSSPAGALDLPTLSFGSSSPVGISGAAPETAILTISTTAATSAALFSPERPGVPWSAAGGAALSCVLLVGIPARRRRWRSMLGMLLLLVILASGTLACGGGDSGGGSGRTSNPGTTAGTYTVTVTGTSGAITATGTINLTVL
jgi:hypothetical protein